MPTGGLPMRFVRDMLRLSWAALESVSDCLGLAAIPGVVGEYPVAARDQGLTSPLAPDENDAALADPALAARTGARGRPRALRLRRCPSEMKRPEVTLSRRIRPRPFWVGPRLPSVLPALRDLPPTPRIH